MQMASEAGITPNEFKVLTYRELDNYITGYRNRMNEQWKQTRFGAYITYCANAKDPVPIDKFLPIGEERIIKRRKRLMTKREYVKMQQNWN